MSVQNGGGNIESFQHCMDPGTKLIQAISYCGCQKIGSDKVMINALGDTKYGFIKPTKESKRENTRKISKL